MFILWFRRALVLAIALSIWAIVDGSLAKLNQRLKAAGLTEIRP